MSSDPQYDVYAWDNLAESKGFDLKYPEQVGEATKMIGPRPFGPRKFASPRCESGKRNYCTCDTCF